ncbi:LAME_0E02344g1_1 [Lachancea meyersii CBS 8951]|uniref:LAME_0E02344g1_1 n=1 Tax=Lachancea meyersii CBS 8951 TaxID=1266667 RepID=A0A1G4JFW5_9SACH|nr:LAME_0E02344g1_1 [Lachancea meyersii CBS 8951]
MIRLGRCARNHILTRPGASLIAYRLQAQRSRDPKHIFTDPSNNEILDTKHFFTVPNQKLDNGQESIATAIQESIKSQRRRRVKQILSAFIVAVVGTIFGYNVGYKVMYLHEQAFIPAYPVPKRRSFTADELRTINVDEIKEMADYKLLEKLSMHPMIKEEYGVPLHHAPGVPLRSREFSVWQENPNPCLAGVLIAPYNAPKDVSKWHSIPFLFKWRLVTRSINVMNYVDSFLDRFGTGTSDLLEVVNANRELGDYKYERPQHYSQNHRASHLWFLGEMDLGDGSMIVYKGRYHVDIKLQQVDLLRRENNELVRYVLYQASEK